MSNTNPNRPPVFNPKQNTAAKKSSWPLIRLVLIFLLITIIALGAWNFFYYQNDHNIDAQAVVQTAIEQTLQAKTLAYQNRSTLFIADEKKVYSDLEGQKDAANSFHVKGQILNTPIEVFQIGNTTYRKDPNTGQWIVTEEDAFGVASMLMTEINPLSNLYIESLGACEYLGREKAGGQMCRKIVCQPTLKNPWIGEHFQDITYTFLINPKTGNIVKLTISAISKENTAANLIMESGFGNYNQDIIIKPPIQ